MERHAEVTLAVLQIIHFQLRNEEAVNKRFGQLLCAEYIRLQLR